MKIMILSVKMDIETIYYLSQVISALAVVIGTAIALFQYISNSKANKTQRKREMELYELQIQELQKDRMQRAIDLSEYYKDNVICYMNILKFIYDSTGISEILLNIPDEKIFHFDEHELHKNVCMQDINRIRNFMDKDEFMNALINASATAGFWPECREEVVLMNDEGKKVKTLRVKEAELKYRFSMMVQNILNNLEYFAMAFTHETADESVVYQSLHGSYMLAVKLLYYDISSNNTNGESKLFTNVIELYNCWKEKAESQKRDEIAVARENISQGNVLKKVDKS